MRRHLRLNRRNLPGRSVPPAAYGIVMRLLRAAFLIDAEHCNLLTQAGFCDVETHHVSGKRLKHVAAFRWKDTRILLNSQARSRP